MLAKVILEWGLASRRVAVPYPLRLLVIAKLLVGCRRVGSADEGVESLLRCGCIQVQSWLTLQNGAYLAGVQKF